MKILLINDILNVEVGALVKLNGTIKASYRDINIQVDSFSGELDEKLKAALEESDRNQIDLIQVLAHFADKKVKITIEES